MSDDKKERKNGEKNSGEKNANANSNGSAGKKEEQKNSAEGGGSSPAFIILILAAIAILWFGFKSTKPSQNNVTSSVPTVQETVSTEITQRLVILVKEHKSTLTEMDTVERFKHFRQHIEESKNVKVEEGDWSVKPAVGETEKDRYYIVTYTWKENNSPVIFEWKADTKDNTFTALNEAAKSFDDFEKTVLAAAINPEGTTTPTPDATATTTPVDSPSPGTTPSGITLTPLATTTPAATPTSADINIMPPATPIPSPPPIPATPVTGPPPPISGPSTPVDIPVPDLPEEAPPYKMVGFIRVGNQNKVMLMKDNRTFDATQGTQLSDGWTVSAVTENSVTIKKGRTTKTLNLRQNDNVAPPPTVQPGQYPRATPRNSGGGTSPSGQPTVIPID